MFTASPLGWIGLSLHPGGACLLGEPQRWVTRMDEGGCGGQHGADNRGGIGDSDAMLGSADGAMENGESACAFGAGRLIASRTDTALTGWSHGIGR